MHQFKPTDEFKREMLAFANKGGPDTLVIYPSKAVKLKVCATRGGRTLFDMGEITLSKGDCLRIDDLHFEITMD